MAGVNKVILIGNLGADPEVRHLQNGASVANFNMATTEVYKDKQTGERREITEWHRVVAWRWHAETAERFLRKGSKVYVEGKLRTRQYQDKDGQNRYITEVVVDEMNLLDRPSQDRPAQAGVQQQPASAGPRPEVAAVPVAASEPEDDLPF